MKFQNVNRSVLSRSTTRRLAIRFIPKNQKQGLLLLLVAVAQVYQGLHDGFTTTGVLQVLLLPGFAIGCQRIFPAHYPIGIFLASLTICSLTVSNTPAVDSCTAAGLSSLIAALYTGQRRVTRLNRQHFAEAWSGGSKLTLCILVSSAVLVYNNQNDNQAILTLLVGALCGLTAGSLAPIVGGYKLYVSPQCSVQVKMTQHSSNGTFRWIVVLLPGFDKERHCLLLEKSIYKRGGKATRDYKILAAKNEWQAIQSAKEGKLTMFASPHQLNGLPPIFYASTPTVCLDVKITRCD